MNRKMNRMTNTESVHNTQEYGIEVNHVTCEKPHVTTTKIYFSYFSTSLLLTDLELIGNHMPESLVIDNTDEDINLHNLTVYARIKRFLA